MEKEFKQNTPSNQNWKTKDKETKGAGAESYKADQGAKGGIDPKQTDKENAGRENIEQGAQDAQMKNGRTGGVGSADPKDQNQDAKWADDQSVDKDDSTKSFAADSQSRGSSTNDSQSRPSTRGSQNSRH